MADYSRRSFLGLAAALPTLAASQTNRRRAGSESPMHPLDGIRRENITIRDIKVTLMSYELPRNNSKACTATSTAGRSRKTAV